MGSCLHSASFAITALIAAPLAAQSVLVGPSVLDLQRSYHVGIYELKIEVPSGALRVVAEHGDLDFTAAGTMTGSLDIWEWNAQGGTFTPNEMIAGNYGVGPSGMIEVDLDPSNPGTDVLQMFIAPDGDVMHISRYDLDPEAFGIFAVAKSTGQSNASMNGDYNFYGQGISIAGGVVETYADWGVATFDGAGNATINGTSMEVASNGTVTTGTNTGTVPYAVAPDGELVLDGIPGGLSPTGELLFLADGSTTNPEVGLVLGVRVGGNYDLNDLAGKYSLTGMSVELGTSPSQPLTVTDVGELVITASSPTSGTWSAEGITVDGNAFGLSFGTLSASGPVQLAPNGVATLSFPTTGFIELAFSDSGRYAAGRIDGNDTNLFFAVRSCPCEPFGTDTAGSGGIAPELGMRTFPTLGNSNWSFAIDRGLGSAPAILPIAFAGSPAGLPLSGGLLWLDPTRVAANPFVVLSGPAGVPGAGAVDVTIAIPATPSFEGVDLFAQALVLDPGAPQTVSFSRALAVEFCR